MVYTFAQYLHEAFERPYSLRRGSGSLAKGLMVWSATTATGQALNVEVSERWVAPRNERHNAEWQLDFTVDGSVGRVPSGNPWRVFATVLDGAARFIAAHREAYGVAPFRFVFHAKTEDTRRESVYRALLKRFAPRAGYELTGVREDGDSTVLEITRKAK